VIGPTDDIALVIEVDGRVEFGPVGLSD